MSHEEMEKLCEKIREKKERTERKVIKIEMCVERLEELKKDSSLSPYGDWSLGYYVGILSNLDATIGCLEELEREIRGIEHV